jgi:hypothetical protein
MVNKPEKKECKQFDNVASVGSFNHAIDLCDAYYNQELANKDAEIEEANNVKIMQHELDIEINRSLKEEISKLKAENERLNKLRIQMAEDMDEDDIIIGNLESEVYKLKKENEKLRKHIERVGDVENLKNLVIGKSIWSFPLKLKNCLNYSRLKTINIIFESLSQHIKDVK